MERPSFRDYDHREMPVTVMAVDYPAGHVTDRHQHPHAQLVHAVHGVMFVSTDLGQWIVPPTRAIWMPAHTEHWIRMVSSVQMRTAFIRPDAAGNLPAQCGVIAVSPLLRELVVAAIAVPQPYTPDTRDGRLMQLLLDEISTLPTLPLSLRYPTDKRLKLICDTITENPDTHTTAAEWAEKLEVDPKTIQRLFAKQTGMTFGRWRQQVRLLKALERLATGEKVVDVALDLGYNSPSAFATMFKRQFGVAPSTFFR